MTTETETKNTAEEALSSEKRASNALRVVGWLSVGVAVAAVGIYVGREIRSRYKFKRRTPYDFYANAAEMQSDEYGVGV